MDLKNSESRELILFLSATLIAVSIFSFWLFGTTGIRVALGILAVSAPFYLIIDRLQLTDGEKFVFSMLLGITIFPSMVYITGLIISFRISILVDFLALILIAFIFRKIRPKI